MTRSFPIHQVADHAVHEPADRVSHHFLCDRILLVRFLVHEHERRFVAIQELGFPFADVGGFQSVAALVGSVDEWYSSTGVAAGIYNSACPCPV